MAFISSVFIADTLRSYPQTVQNLKAAAALDETYSDRKRVS
ncbi:hypothetical protein ALQ32_200171 [Pseudomonas syringae pv. tagetis]|uniref:Uncharacterized protein n=1 Tax=Pseudomonas syringae pv. tagetis TaxID=129140 RepID=A0A3M3ZFM6_9PSED|nr:hypothetical protein ALQ32_200171 [Pseudomonas syringae pv. tagetis]